MMNRWQVEKEDLEALQRSGFTTRQISILYSLRTTYLQDRMDQPALDIRRLEFARFLVATGRLTDEKQEKYIAAYKDVLSWKKACLPSLQALIRTTTKEG